MVGGWRRWPRALGPVRAALVAVALGAATVVAGLGLAPPGWAVPPGLAAASDADLQGLGLAGGDFAGQAVLDRDRDGLPDSFESIRYGTDPERASSAAGGVPDGWLLRFGYDPADPTSSLRVAAAPPTDALPAVYRNAWPTAFLLTLGDVYSFGRPATWNESKDGPFDSGLDPREWDNSGDGIPDGWALAYGLDPLTDVRELRPAGAFGLTVQQAFAHGTDPRELDTDDDGLDDATEIAGAVAGGNRLPPSDPRRYDSGGAGVCDGYLAAHGLDPSAPASSYSDQDLDGASTAQEFSWSLQHRAAAACKSGSGLDPRAARSGSSQVPDGWLIRHGLDPLEAGIDAKATQSAQADPREPGPAPAGSLGLTVLDEYRYGRPAQWDEAKQGPWLGGTDPTAADTDGDGLGDAYEQAGFLITVLTQTGDPPSSTALATADPTLPDSDLDGATDAQEAGQGTDPRRSDTDFDGLSDGVEAGLGLGLDGRRADTAKDGLRDGVRYEMLRQRQAAYAADPTYEYAGHGSRSLRDWVTLMPGAGATPGSAPPDSLLLALVGPQGDLDADGVPNLVDQDMDGDGLRNADELRPPLDRFGLPAVPATDPLNADTDGDALPDQWELDLRTPSALVLDPTRWDTDGDGIDDGADDLDGDGITWTSFAPGPSPNRFAMSNLVEYRLHSDPLDKRSDGDGLDDGWKAFWGLTYPGLPPAAVGDVYPSDGTGAFRVPPQPRPQLGTPQERTAPSSLLRQASYDRYALSPPTAPGETSTGTVQVATSSGTRTMHRIHGVVDVRFHDVQGWGTNPYLLDTDGDTMPDWWEVATTAVPTGVDRDLAQCVAGPAVDPLRPDGMTDADGDGAAAAQEWAAGSHPLCADTDMAGVPDQQEALLRLDPADPRDDASLRDQASDLDDDGLSDFDELTRLGTRHDDPDTDGDGLLDGPSRQVSAPTAALFLELGIASRVQGGARTFLGEADPLITTDPLDADDYDAGVPAGWVALRLASPLEASSAADMYRLGRPAWWDETRHGPWWGGGNPQAESYADLRFRLDLDGDGLDDRDPYGDPSDDLFPAANGGNTARQPTAAAPAGLAERVAAQARLNPAPWNDARYAVAHPVHDEQADERPAVCLQDVKVAGATPTASTELRKGGTASVTGKVRPCAPADAAAHVDGVAVQVLVAGQGFGGAFTDPTGAFTVPLALDGNERDVTVPEGARTAFRGVGNGTATWSPDPSQVPVGAASLAVRASGSAAQKAAQATYAVQVVAAPSLSLDVPAHAAAGAAVAGRLRLADGAGDGLSHQVRLHWNGKAVATVTPRADGSADFLLPAVPPSEAGRVVLDATSVPPSGQPALASASVEVRRNGILELTVPAPATAGDGLMLQGAVWSILGPGAREAVPGAQVTLRLDGLGAPATVTTDGRGRFTATLAVPADAARGPRAVLANASAPFLEPPSVSVQAQLRSLPRIVQVSMSNLSLAEPARVEGRLVEPDGAPAPGIEVVAALGEAARNGTTNATGAFAFSFPAPARPGPLLQSIQAKADAGHGAASRRDERIALATTALSVEDGVVAPGVAAKVLLRLTAAGSGVADAPLRVRWADEAPRTVSTGRDGTAWFVRPPLASDALGTVVVAASFDGGGGHGPSAAAAAWSIRSQSLLLLPNGTFTAGTPSPQGRLVDASTGEGIAHGEVTVVSAGVAAARVTDAQGRFAVLAPTPKEHPPGVHSFTAAYKGVPGRAPAAASSNLTVRSPSSLSCVGPTTLSPGVAAPVACGLVDGRGLPVEGGEAVAVLDGQALVAAPVKGGEARLPVVLPAVRAATVDVTFLFNGTARHAPSNVTVTLRVTQPVDLRLDVDAARRGEVARITVTATSAGEPVPSQPLLLFLPGQATPLRFATNESGVAEVPVLQDAAHLPFLVRSEGSQGLAPAAVAGALEAAPTLGEAARSMAVPIIAAVGVMVVAWLGYLAALRPADPLERALQQARLAIRARGPVERQVLIAYRLLEDAAIGAGALQGQAKTARLLQEQLAGRLPAGAGEALERLIGLFERARYGAARLPPQARGEAMAALTAIQRALRRGVPA